MVETQQRLQRQIAAVESQEKQFENEFSAEKMQIRLAQSKNRLLTKLEENAIAARNAVESEFQRCKAELETHFADVEATIAARFAAANGATRAAWKSAANEIVALPIAARDFSENIELYKSGKTAALCKEGESLSAQLANTIVETERSVASALTNCQIGARNMPSQLFSVRTRALIDSSVDLVNLLESETFLRDSLDLRVLLPDEEPPSRPLRRRSLISAARPKGWAAEAAGSSPTGARTIALSPRSIGRRAPSQGAQPQNSPKTSRNPFKASPSTSTRTETRFYAPKSVSATPRRAANRASAAPTPGKAASPRLIARLERGSAAILRRLLGGRHAAAVRNLQRDQLVCLDLSDGGLSDQEIAALAPLIASATALRTLRLAQNALTNEGVAYLSHALAEATLTTIDLSGNQVTDEAIGFLQRLLAVNANLKTVNLRRNRVNARAVEALLGGAQSIRRSIDL